MLHSPHLTKTTPSTSFNSIGCHLLHTQQTSSSSVNSTSLNSCESSDDNSIVTFVVKKPKRKFIPPYLAGDLPKKSNLDILQSSAKKSKLKLTTPMSTKNPKKKTQPKVAV
jgi:hypothetical protein